MEDDLVDLCHQGARYVPRCWALLRQLAVETFCDLRQSVTYLLHCLGIVVGNGFFGCDVLEDLQVLHVGLIVDVSLHLVKNSHKNFEIGRLVQDDLRL